MSADIKTINGGGKPDALAESLRSLRKNLPLLIEYQELRAQLLHAAFENFKAQGFTDEQALELCKGMT